MKKIQLIRSKNEIRLPIRLIERYGVLTKDRKEATQVKIGPRKTTKQDRSKPMPLTKFFLEQEQAEDKQKQKWSNKIIWGDNRYVLTSLRRRYSNNIKLIYIDPPFFTGTNVNITIPVGEDVQLEKQPTPVESLAYRNIWKEDNPANSFMQWFADRAFMMKDLLSIDGFILVRFDYHFGHYVKLVLDEIFGPENFCQEFFVRRMVKNLSLKQAYNQRHLIVYYDSLFLYQKSNESLMNASLPKVKRKNGDPIEYQHNNDDIWLDITGYEKTKKTLYPTENSERLLNRVIQTFSNEGDIVADFFGGSGTTVAMAEKLNRKWLSVDIGRFSIHETRKRILRIPNYQPFRIYNLSMYRKHLFLRNQQLEKKGNIKEESNTILNDYYQFILSRFDAEPILGYEHIHGRKREALIHVGHLDKMVSQEEIELFIGEAKDLDTNEFIILGWDFIMEIDFFSKLIMEWESKVISLKRIPIQILEDPLFKSDFQDLPFASIEIEPNANEVTIKIADFKINDTFYLEKSKMDKITSFVDLIDYWAIDWNYNGEIFRNNWCSFRELSRRKVKFGITNTASHTYSKAGEYTILINIVDILGNDITERAKVIIT